MSDVSVSGCSGGCLGGGLTDPSTRTLLSSLSASFDAAIARAEDEAATDLAISLQQGRSLHELATRQPVWVVLTGGRASPVMWVGRDFFATVDGDLIPTGRTVLRLEGAGRRAERRSENFLSVLRRWARQKAVVELQTDDGYLSGHLLLGGKDHVVIKIADSDVAIGLGAIRAIKRARGGSEGEP